MCGSPSKKYLEVSKLGRLNLQKKRNTGDAIFKIFFLILKFLKNSTYKHTFIDSGKGIYYCFKPMLDQIIKTTILALFSNPYLHRKKPIMKRIFLFFVPHLSF